MLTYALVAGVLFGLYFSLVGIGLNLVFGVMRIVNLAHGDFVMLGAFLAFWLFTMLAVNPAAAVAIAFIAFVIVGVPLYYLLVPRLLRAKDPEMLSF
ncbi:MAG: ABC transporter permease subunit, partial [Bradyrhizobium sp.]